MIYFYINLTIALIIFLDCVFHTVKNYRKDNVDWFAVLAVTLLGMIPLVNIVVLIFMLSHYYDLLTGRVKE